MKARLNNLISKYETQLDLLEANGAPTPAVQCEISTVKEVLKALRYLRS